MQQNPLVLYQITNNFIAKYLLMENNNSLTKTVRELFEFLLTNDLVCQVFKQQVNRVLN
jgi:hypothetical protein